MKAGASPTRDPRFGLRADRLRAADWLVFAAAIALLIDLLVPPWDSLSGSFATGLGQLGHDSAFHAGEVLHILTPLTIVCAMLALVLWLAQMTFRAPAIALSLTAYSLLLDLILLVGLIIRVYIARPGPSTLGLPGQGGLHPDIASLLGVIFCALLVLGTWSSLRADGVSAADAPREIETLTLAPRRR